MIYDDTELHGKYDPLRLHNTNKLITLTPFGLSSTFIKKRKLDSKQNDLIEQLNYNSLIALKYYKKTNNEDLIEELKDYNPINYYDLYEKLNKINRLDNESFIIFELQIYKLKILYINLDDNERCIVKPNYNKIIDRYVYYYKLIK